MLKALLKSQNRCVNSVRSVGKIAATQRTSNSIGQTANQSGRLTRVPNRCPTCKHKVPAQPKSYALHLAPAGVPKGSPMRAQEGSKDVEEGDDGSPRPGLQWPGLQWPGLLWPGCGQAAAALRLGGQRPPAAWPSTFSLSLSSMWVGATSKHGLARSKGQVLLGLWWKS